MRKALIIVDMSNDFVHNDGSLSVKEPAQKIVPNIINLADETLKNDGVVIFANDEHPNGIDHKWPRHNEPNTWGCEIYGELGVWLKKKRQEESAKLFFDKRVFYISKESYNAFNTQILGSYIEGLKIKNVIITGVCTDICILQTVAGAFDYKLNPYINSDEYNLDIEVPKDCVATFSEYGEIALQMMKNYYNVEII